MTITDYIVWINEHILTPLFNFDLSFWGVTFGSIVVAVFGLPLLVKAYRKFF